MDGRQPRAGRHYPRSTGEFQSWFATDADCLDYLEWLRWPDGFVCPRCADAADGVVHRVLDVRRAEGRRLGAEPAASARDRCLAVRTSSSAESMRLSGSRSTLFGTAA